MSHQFKAGDLALIVGSAAEHLIGSQVEIIECLGSDQMMDFYADGIQRTVLNLGFNVIWIVRLLSKTYLEPENGIETAFGPCREQWLMPLRGDLAPEKQEEREVAA